VGAGNIGCFLFAVWYSGSSDKPKWDFRIVLPR